MSAELSKKMGGRTQKRKRGGDPTDIGNSILGETKRDGTSGGRRRRKKKTKRRRTRRHR